MTNTTIYSKTIKALQGLNSAQAISSKARELLASPDSEPEDFVEALISQHKAAGDRVETAHAEFVKAVERYDKLDSMISALSARDRARGPSPQPAVPSDPSSSTQGGIDL